MARRRLDRPDSGAGSPRLVEVTLLSDPPANGRRPRRAPARLGVLAVALAILFAVTLGALVRSPPGRAPRPRSAPAAAPAARAPDADPMRCLGVSCLPPGIPLPWPVNARAERVGPVVVGDADR